LNDSDAQFIPVVDGMEFERQVSTCNGYACSAPVSQALIDYINSHTAYRLSGKLVRGTDVSLDAIPTQIFNACLYRPLGTTIALIEKPIGSTLEGNNPSPYASRKRDLENWGWEVSETYTGSQYRVIAICKGIPRQ
jgi:hypothetical protein